MGESAELKCIFQCNKFFFAGDCSAPTLQAAAAASVACCALRCLCFPAPLAPPPHTMPVLVRLPGTFPCSRFCWPHFNPLIPARLPSRPSSLSFSSLLPSFLHFFLSPFFCRLCLAPCRDYRVYIGVVLG